MALIDIKRLRMDGGTQHRVKVNPEAIADYCAAYLDDKKMPPVQAVYDGAHYWLWDGFHRIAGAVEAGKKGINVEITRGTQRDAFLLSLGANDAHGIRRTNEDKRNAVRAALQDSDLAAMSDREIAKICGVYHQLVATMRPDAPKKEASKVDEASTNLAPPATTVDTQATLPGVPAPPSNVRPIIAKVAPIGRLEEITIERDELRDKLGEGAQMLQESEDELRVLREAVRLDDTEQALRNEIARLRKRITELEERQNSLLGEASAAVRQANHWKRKCVELERAAKKR